MVAAADGALVNSGPRSHEARPQVARRVAHALVRKGREIAGRGEGALGVVDWLTVPLPSEAWNLTERCRFRDRQAPEQVEHGPLALAANHVVHVRRVDRR